MNDSVFVSLNLDQWLSQERWSSDSSSSSEEEGGGGAVFAPPHHDPRPTAQFTPEELQMVTSNFILIFIRAFT